MRCNAIGFVEVVGLVAAIEAGDAMAKAAQIRLLKYHHITPGLVTVVVEGDLASCRAAVDAGVAAATRVGQVVSSLVLGRPDRDTETLVLDFLPEAPAGGSEAPPRVTTGAPSANDLPKVVHIALPNVVSPLAPVETETEAEAEVGPGVVQTEVAQTLAEPISDVPSIMATELVAAPDREEDKGATLESEAPDDGATGPVLIPEPLKTASVETAPEIAAALSLATAAVAEPVHQHPAEPAEVELPAPESLLAYVSAAARGRTCQEVARRFQVPTVKARALLDQWVTEGRLEKQGSRYLLPHGLF